mgnify:CR=1 FL=1
MDKKILRAMFKTIAEVADPYRTNLLGVHFEANRCYATDTHVLVIYKQGNENLAGQTVAFNGEIVKGNYPAVDRVVPKDMPDPALPIDLAQLNRALKWYVAQPGNLKDDVIAFGEIGYSFRNLITVLNFYDLAGELSKVSFFLSPEPCRPAKFESETLTAIVMPININEENIDKPRTEDTVSVSYEMLISKFAANRGKKKKAVVEMDWL